MVTGLWDEVNHEVLELHSKFARDRTQFRAEVATEMAEFRAEVRNEMARFRADIAGEISQLRANICNGHAQLAANFVEIRGTSSNHNSMHLLLCQQTRLPVPSLGLRLPLAPPMEEHAASTPSASSVISNILSTSSVPHVGSLTLDSPTARAAASLPTTGPLGVTRDRIQIPGKPMHLVIVITKLNTPISTQRNPSH